ncbi:MAG: 30S ribosomal protein S6 [Proteobacteria bacterium]|nr:30S ribosomal protein S6 [Pseudomonadota bacterium]
MPLYESVFIARQDLTPAQVESLSGNVSDLIKTQGGKVTKTEQWGLKNLAYRINKNKKGHYVLLNIDAPSDAIAEMERTMRINEDVLRYLTIRVEELEEGPSAMLRKRDDDPREGGGFGERGGFGGGPRGDRGDRGGSGRPMRPRGPRPEEAVEGEQA